MLRTINRIPVRIKKISHIKGPIHLCSNCSAYTPGGRREGGFDHVFHRSPFFDLSCPHTIVLNYCLVVKGSNIGSCGNELPDTPRLHQGAETYSSFCPSVVQLCALMSLFLFSHVIPAIVIPAFVGGSVQLFNQ